MDTLLVLPPGEHLRKMQRKNSGNKCNCVRHLRRGEGRGVDRYGGEHATRSSGTTYVLVFELSDLLEFDCGGHARGSLGHLLTS